ncbi:hypothetical protein H7K14_00065 [Mycolicibacter longobardus]|uniref:8-oxoguanine DNA glycosylase OGG fold protein n=1 Tax=Mycolicibacter longobardus TaxID=1108812 RepID=UPI0021F2A539|nr:hypothetical protein [Mycolicibacter longobardus]MCV7382223.1 hypothetical protein [Mycolicibacter longobardus]
MTATPLTDIHLPEQAVAELRSADVAEWIHGHAIPVGRPWWTQTLTAHGFADTLIGETIRRADIFALADTAPETPQAALTLLWNSLAWGSGDKLRNNRARIASIAADRVGAAAVLQQAAALSHTDPQSAYHLLYPRNRTAICNLGPAFFTKYLYFAGGGDPAHPCCILDENVVLALQKTCGWKSLPLRGWLDSAYQRYATLLGIWVDEHSLDRPDIIERWLFEEGKRIRNDNSSKPVRSIRHGPDERRLVSE